MLQISHLYADYGGKPALEDINLTLESGELLVVLGPSGCGKTTLLNLIAGFVPYQHGSIQLAGKGIQGPGAERGVVFQNEGLLSWVINSTCFPVSCQSFSSRVCIWSRVKASSAPNGSSSNNSWGFAANARAIPTR